MTSLDDRLDAYLDDQLTPRFRAEFEQRLAEHPPLADEIALQRRIDAALREALAPPASAALQPGLDALPAPRPRRMRLATPLAAAAGLVLALTGAWMIWSAVAPPSAPPSPYRPQAPMTLTAWYEQRVDEGLQPDWACESDEQFARAFAERFGQPLLIRSAAGVEVAGLAYGNTVSPGTIAILARCDGTPVAAFVDHVRADRPLPAPGPGLHLHRGEIGELVVYELSPMPAPCVSGLLYDPD